MSESSECESQSASSGDGVYYQLGTLALNRINDVIDFEIEHIFMDPLCRIDHYESLMYFWNLHPAKDIPCGRMFVRLQLAKLLVMACGRSPYGGKDVDDDPTLLPRSEQYPALYEMNSEDWGQLEIQLNKIRSLSLRKDVALNYLDASEIPDDAAFINVETSKLPLFGERFSLVIRRIQANQAVASVRKQIEELTAENKQTSLPPFEKEEISKILEAVETLQNHSAQQDVLGLFQQNDHGYSFIQQDKLVQQFKSKNFNLFLFQDSLNALIQNINTALFGKNQSVLLKLHYTVRTGSQVHQKISQVPKEGNSAAVDNLRKRRDALKQGHGPDPLEESIRMTSQMRRLKDVANQIRAVRENRNVGQRRDAPAAGEHSGSESQSPARYALSPPSKQSSLRAVSRNNASVPPDDGIFAEDGRVKKRRRWMQEEKECIKEGVKKFGVGQWALIKSEYAYILRNRTTVQLKDCYRTLLDKGELKGVELSKEEANVNLVTQLDTENNPQNEQPTSGRKGK